VIVPPERVEGAVEQHGLDPLVVVEPLQVAQVRCRGRDVRVQVRAAVAGHLEVVGGRHGGAAQPLADAADP
jgi:hypothetical protein